MDTRRTQPSVDAAAPALDALPAFAPEAVVASLQADLEAAHGAGRLPLLVALAWHLRQRDTERAQALAQEARALLADASAPPQAARRAMLRRLALVDVEAAWLWADLPAAELRAAALMDECRAEQDRLCEADTAFVRALVALDAGRHELREQAMADAAEAAQAAGDAERGALCDAVRAVFASYWGSESDRAHWEARLAPRLAESTGALRGLLHDFFGSQAYFAGQLQLAIEHRQAQFELMCEHGAMRRAIISCLNAATALNDLNAFDEALEWLQRGLALARPRRWPATLGIALVQTAVCLRELGQLDKTLELLDEAKVILQPLQRSRNYLQLHEQRGIVLHQLGRHEEALLSFQAYVAGAEREGAPSLLVRALREQAPALQALGRLDAARQTVQRSLALAEQAGDPQGQMEALYELARLHTGEDAALPFLQRCLALAAQVPSFRVPERWLRAAAAEHARRGEHAQAYELTLKALEALREEQQRRATDRALALEVHHRTERTKAEAAHLRQLADEQAQRAEVLARTTSTLERLGRIGQEITAHLEASTVYAALSSHVHGLLDAASFSIFLLQEDGRRLRRAFGVELGAPLPAREVPLDHPSALVALCARERIELARSRTPEEAAQNSEPGTLPTLAALYAPLMIGERLLGVLTIQSMRQDAYGEREQLILRTLCAYGAIALDNATAYRRLETAMQALRDTQAQLVERNHQLQQVNEALQNLSFTDALTGLRNRRYLQQQMDAEVSLVLRAYEDWLKGGAPEPTDADLAFFLLDLDHFKTVNDTHGHAAGDQVLAQLRDRLRQVCRDSDYIVRWGGEEFLVVARATDRRQAGAMAERLRLAVGGRPFLLPDGRWTERTCSVGFACFPFLPHQPAALHWEQVMGLTDRALYAAKAAGRNTWVGVQASGTLASAEALAQAVEIGLDGGLEAAEAAGLVQLLRP